MSTYSAKLTWMELAETPQTKSQGKLPWAGLFSGGSGKPFFWMTFLEGKITIYDHT